jgi:hypothetical protein
MDGKISMMRRLLPGALALGLCVAAAGPAHAGLLVNVQFTNGGPGYSGAGVLGAAGDTWNAFGTPGSSSNLPLVSSGGAASTVTLSYSAPDGFFDATGFFATFQGTSFQNLLDAYLVTSSSTTVSFDGLTPDATYTLILYSASNDPTRDTLFTVDGVTQAVVTPDTALTPGDGYAMFTATADASGQLSILVAAGAGGEGDLNGIQLQQAQAASAAPEPASLTLLGVGAAGLALGAWRRRKCRPALCGGP